MLRNAPMLSILRRPLAIIAALVLTGCAAFSGLPPGLSTEDRLKAMPTAGLPLQRPVNIYWSKEQIPFIEAQTDTDAAFALGLVHAHLRLGQIEVLRRVSQGRLEEIGGPFGRVRAMGRALRILELGRSSDAVYAAMAPPQKAFLDSFVAGLNHYQSHMAVAPYEYGLLGIAPEPFKPQEILTLGRLASVDVSWFTWFSLLPLRGRPDWPQLWNAALKRGTGAEPLVSEGQKTAALQGLNDLLANTARIGSNSFAVGGGKTQSRAAIIASDPHLGTNLPNMWLLAGFKSPSYHTVGFMIPGLPFVAEGRNERIAWGGTNLRSAASDLIDVSRLPADQIKTRQVNVKVRWWSDETETIRETPYGPIISDAELIPKLPGESFAIKWIGHRPSDEFSAMLGVARAGNWGEFRSALENFSISAQNFVYADVAGNIGQMVTTHVPRRSETPPADLVRPLSDAAAWDTILNSGSLPQSYNPPEGFVASANDTPPKTPFPIGYFFGGNDRVMRMREVLGAKTNVTVDDLKELQRDTYMASAVRLRDALVKRARGIANLPPEARNTLELIAAWNGRYDADSKGAVAFEGTVAALIPLLATPLERDIIEIGGSEYAIYADKVAASPPGVLELQIAASLTEAQKSVAAYPVWGDMHALRLRHTFGVLPLIGGRYVYRDIPWPGSNETIWRAGHGLSGAKMNTGFGSQARHISDMADLDSNWFALLGGNDGWFNSANFFDQVENFRSSTLIEVPLRLESVRAKFPYRTTLNPQ